MRGGFAAAAATVLAALAAPWAAQGGSVPALPVPLTTTPGDPVRGRAIVRDLGKASCLICHAMPIPEEPDHGDIGPPLAGIARRASPAELRQRLVDARVIDARTLMPPYFRATGLLGVLRRFEGKTIYTAQEIEDVLAYLLTLDQP